MPARKVYNEYYENGSAARNYQTLPKEEITRKPNTVRRVRKNSLRQQAAQRRKNVSMVAFVLCAFSMALLITYRFNLINEKNLEVQNLINNLEIVSSEVATAKIEVDQNTDLNSIEAYAKQQLGMKKVDSSQMVYIDTAENINTVQVNQNTTVLEKIINYIKSIF